MKKQATDFALMAGAFGRDHNMARQVCSLLAGGDVTEDEARKLLRLVGDGKLQSGLGWYYTYSTPYIPRIYGVATTAVPASGNDITLTTMALNAIGGNGSDKVT